MQYTLAVGTRLNFSLKTRLILIITLVSTVSVILACFAFVAFERYLLRQELVRDLATLSDITGINSTVALLSGNRVSAAETLTALRAEPNIAYAAIFSTDGQVFASYVRGNRKSNFLPSGMREDGAYFQADSVVFFRSIATKANEKIGVVCIQSDLNAGSSRLMSYVGILTLILAGSFLVALGLSSRLQRVVSGPILHLLQIEARVSHDNDYSIRAEKHGQDELGMLIEGFNHMLSQIQQRDQALQEKEQEYRTLLENVPIGVYRTTPDGRVLHANPALLEMMGYHSLQDIAFIDLQQKSPYVGISREEFCRRLEREGEIRGFEMLWTRRDGSTIFVRENAKVIRDEKGNPVCYEGTLEDISEKKRIEQMKDEFVSVVSHELRVPLTSIRGTLEWISQKAGEHLNPNMRKMIDIAARSSERMGRLINDMLDAEKLESGRMVFQTRPVEVSAFLQQAMEAHQGLAQQYGVQFVLQEAPEGLRVSADTDRLMQVFANLLSNAAKFSPANGTVVLAARRSDRGMMRLTVTDRGAGIPVKFRPLIFQKFAQAEGADRRQKGGTGLGLSITKAIVERMGGKIGFETQVGVGTTFYLDLPEY